MLNETERKREKRKKESLPLPSASPKHYIRVLRADWIRLAVAQTLLVRSISGDPPECPAGLRFSQLDT